MTAITTTLTDRFHCSLERAFRAPILGDATRFLNGYRLQPPIVGFEDDSTWGQPGGVRYPMIRATWLVPGGRLLKDSIIERTENDRWVWQVTEFRPASLFFIDRAVGQWQVAACNATHTDVTYGYTYHAKASLYYPLLKAFVALQVVGMMQQALVHIREFAESDAEFCYR